MSLNGGSYDESLLRSAPAATREQLQEGYNADLLTNPVRSKSVKQARPVRQVPSGAAPPMPPVPLRSGTASDIEQGTIPGGANPTNSYTALGEKPVESEKRPFWRTTMGIVVIIIVILVIIAAVVGGAVGGTAHNHNNRSSNQTTITSLASTDTDMSTNTLHPGGPVLSDASTTSSSSLFHVSVPVPTPSIAQHDSGIGAVGLAGVTPVLLNGPFQVLRNKQAADPPRPTAGPL